MTDRVASERVLRELYAARVAGQLEPLCRLFSSDAHFRICGATEGKPIAIAAQGHSEIRTWLATLVKTFRLSDQAVLSMVIEGERAAVHWRARIYSRITGVVVPTEFVDLIELRDAQILSYVEFFVPC